MKFDNKVAVVTGGAGGIGSEIVRTLVNEGAKVVIVEAENVDGAYNQYQTNYIGGITRAKEMEKEFKDKINVIAADVSKNQEVTNAINEIVNKFNTIDILINVAGVVTAGPVEEIKEEEWDLMMDINTKGTFLFCKEVLPIMKKQNYGRIINFASIAGKIGIEGLSHYCASKFAVIGFTNAVAKEVASYNITVNSICPGIVFTQMWDLLAKKFSIEGESIQESFNRNVKTMIPQKVAQTPQDMAKAVIFLLESEHITGQAMAVSGGAAI
ncbi:MAG: SDR family NAD(P)-dependent oxidoreductase [Deferribacterota bacterium]|nr:SDR family NAD(P)-dependent oxidoreductase [Deferribacterota bacterium]